MLHVQDRRRHERMVFTCPVVLKDKAGRVIFKGRSADLTPCGVKVVGPPPAAVSEGMDVWLEMKVQNRRANGPRSRVVKQRGYIRRITDMGEWKSVIVVIIENDLSKRVLEPRP